MSNIIIISIAVLASLINALSLTWAWGWFITPVFNVPELPYSSALAVGFCLGLIKYSWRPTPEYTTDQKIEICVVTVLLSLFVLAGVCAVRLFS